MHRLCSFGIQRGNYQVQVSPGSRRKRDVVRLPKPRPESRHAASCGGTQPNAVGHARQCPPPPQYQCSAMIYSGETCSWKLAGRQPAAVTQTGRFASSSTEVSIAHWSGRRLSAATCLEQHGRKALCKQPHAPPSRRHH